LDVLDKHSEPEVILRVLTCLVNIHSIVIKHRTAESSSGQQTSSSSSLHSKMSSATSVFSDGDYLQRLRQKLCSLCEHSDSDVRESAIRLLCICQ